LNVSFFSDVFSLHFLGDSETVSAGFGLGAAGFSGGAALGGGTFSANDWTAAFPEAGPFISGAD